MAGKRDDGTEVVGLITVNTSDNADQPSPSPAKSPRLDRHISVIPQDDDNEAANATEPSQSKNPLKKLKNKITDRKRHDEPQSESATSSKPLTGPDMPTKLKRNISSIPVDDYDSESEQSQPQPQPQAQPQRQPQSQPQPQPSPTAVKDERHDSGISNGSDFEVAPMLRISSDETRRPGRGTKKPELERHISQLPQDDGHESGSMSKLERTISHIPQDDYDSDDAR